MTDKDQKTAQGTDQANQVRQPEANLVRQFKIVDLIPNKKQTKTVKTAIDELEKATPDERAKLLEDMGLSYQALESITEKLRDVARKAEKALTIAPDMLEKLKQAADNIKRIQPFIDTIFEAYPDNEAWYMHKQLSIIISPIGAFMQDRGLQDGRGIKAYKDDFLAFFQAYISEMEAAYNEDPNLDLEAAQRTILDGLIKQEAAAAAEQQTMTIIEGYNLMSQGPLVHEFMKKAKIRPGNFTVDELTGSMRIEEDGLITLIENSASLRGGLKDTTKRFLLVMLCENTKQGRKSDTITLPLQAFMDMCGLKDLKAARQQAVDDMKTLYSISLSASSGGSKRRGGDFTNIRLCSKQEIKNGVIAFRMGQDFYEMARKWSIMPYPESAFKLNLKYNPHGQNIALTLARHKYANKGKANETLISVRSLLAACPGIPRYEDIAQAGQLTKRIIDPFERDMDALQEVGALASWEYCHSKGGPIEDGELSGGWTYDLFSSLLIQFDMDGYPDQTKRLASRSRYVKAAAKRKKAGKRTAAKKG